MVEKVTPGATEALIMMTGFSADNLTDGRKVTLVTGLWGRSLCLDMMPQICQG